MKKRLLDSFSLTLLYLLVANLGNLFFGFRRPTSLIATFWESLFFFVFIFLFTGFRNKK